MRRLTLPEAVGAVLDRRLHSSSSRPLAVALSGGGDSLALALAVAAWARRNKRPLLILTVDHRLQPQSAAWLQACEAHAARLGAAFQALVWEGEKPLRGLPAAARAARHALIAQAARQAGAHVILMGHTADDVAEAALMRLDGATTPAPREWAPSPAWPEGRGVFVLRPMLGLTRAEIRDWLRARGETWIEDPANDDPRYARARARRRLGETTPPPPCALSAPGAALAGAVTDDAAGALHLARAAFRDASLQARGGVVAAACLSAAGTTRPPRGERLARLLTALAQPGPVAATLCGARIVADGERILFAREAGEARRGGLAPLAPPPGEARVWDGRFEITAMDDGLRVRPLAGLAARLSPPERKTLAGLPAAARGALPALLDGEGRVFCPALAPTPRASVRALALPRLWAACGTVDREPA